MKISLYPWQQPALDRTKEILQKHNLCLQTSSCGVGKTVIMLQACKDLNLKPLVMCPRSVITSWKRTAENMEVPLVDAITPQRLLYRNSYYTGGKWHLDDVGVAIYDEVHSYASGEKAKSTRILAELKAHQDVKVMLASATLSDSPLKLRACGFLAGLHAFNTSSYTKWCLEHGCYKMPQIRALRFSGGPTGMRAMADIASKLAEFSVRIDSATVPGFPKSLVIPKLLDLDTLELEQFNSIMDEMSEKLKDTTLTDPLIQCLRLRQKCELLKIPLMLELIRESIEEGFAPVTFLCFRDSVAALRDAAAGHKLSASIIQGEQSQTERDNNIDTFQADRTDMMISTIDAGGAGINLNHVKGTDMRRRASFISAGWNASSLIQALGRIHRASNDDVPVVQTIALCANTVEQRVYDAIQSKILRIDTLNNADLGSPNT